MSSKVDGLRQRKNGLAQLAPPKRHKLRPRLNFAPLNTPLRNRLETVGIIWHTISISAYCCLFLYVLLLGWWSWVGIVLPYFIWWYGFDLHTPTNGKVVYRTRDWMRNLKVWEWFVDYFPIKVHMAQPLEPTFTQEIVEQELLPDDEEDLISEDSRTIIDKVFKSLGLSKRLNRAEASPVLNGETVKPHLKYKTVSTGPRYVFGYHPHGVISMGVMGAFATNALRNEPFSPPVRFLKPLFHDTTNQKRLLPGIGYVFPLTLTTQFTLPFYRDYLLSLGLTSASARNIKSIINNGDNSVCVVVGGAQESLLNNMVGSSNHVGSGYRPEEPDDEPLPASSSKEAEKEKPAPAKREVKLVLNKRKGFVRIAIELGNVSLVPCFAFGEADIYHLSIPQPGSYGYAFQQWMKRTFLFTLPFFSARGIFIYDFGFLPFRNPINICIGRPIHVPANALAEYYEKHPEDAPEKPEKPETPTEIVKKLLLSSDSFTNLFKLAKKQPPPRKAKIPQGLLDHFHKMYVDELRHVYEENKHKFGYSEVELNIIE